MVHTSGVYTQQVGLTSHIFILLQTARSGQKSLLKIQNHGAVTNADNRDSVIIGCMDVKKSTITEIDQATLRKQAKQQTSSLPVFPRAAFQASPQFLIKPELYITCQRPEPCCGL